MYVILKQKHLFKLYGFYRKIYKFVSHLSYLFYKTINITFSSLLLYRKKENFTSLFVGHSAIKGNLSTLAIYENIYIQTLKPLINTLTNILNYKHASITLLKKERRVKPTTVIYN